MHLRATRKFKASNKCETGGKHRDHNRTALFNKHFSLAFAFILMTVPIYVLITHEIRLVRIQIIRLPITTVGKRRGPSLLARK